MKARLAAAFREKIKDQKKRILEEQRLKEERERYYEVKGENERIAEEIKKREGDDYERVTETIDRLRKQQHLKDKKLEAIKH